MQAKPEVQLWLLTDLISAAVISVGVISTGRRSNLLGAVIFAQATIRL